MSNFIAFAGSEEIECEVFLFVSLNQLDQDVKAHTFLITGHLP